MKRVILPTDFSDNSWKAMSYASQLYYNTPCKFYILNTYSIPYSQVEVAATQIIEPLQESSEKGLLEMMDRFKELDHHDDSEFISISKFASLVDSIHDLADNDPSTIIVMGTRGASGLEELFLGTMTSHVIKHTKVPVICVPNKAVLEYPKQIMLAIDEDGVDRKDEISELVEIAKSHKASVQVVNVPITEEQTLDKDAPESFVLDNYLDGIYHSYHSLVGYYKEDELTKYAEKNNIDLIAMIKRDRGFWKNLFHHSLTKSMTYYSDIPMLILRD